MRLVLGSRAFDVATRSLVVGAVERAGRDVATVADEAQRMAAEGADAVELITGPNDDEADVVGTIAALRRACRSGIAAGIAVAPARPDLARAAYAAGAVMGAVTGGGAVHDTRAFLDASAAAGVTVVLAHDASAGDLTRLRAGLVARARLAEAAGIPAERIVVEPASAATALLGCLRRVAELGYPVLLSADGYPRGRPAHLAAVALGVIGGCRLVRTRDPKGARRVCDVLAAILEARP